MTCIAIGHDPRPGFIRGIGIADVDGDAFFTHGKDGLFMQHRGTHVRQLAQFAIGDLSDRLGLGYHPWIRHQYAGHIGPILVQVHIQCIRHDRTRHIRSAT